MLAFVACSTLHAVMTTDEAVQMTRDKVQELFHDHDVVKAGVRMLHAMVAMSKLVADSDFADAVEA